MIIEERIAEINKLIDGLRKKDFSRKELGPMDDFQQVEKTKNRIADYLGQIFKQISNSKSYESKLLFGKYLDLANGKIGEMLKINGKIAKMDKHNNQFPEERKRIVVNINECERDIKEALYTLENDLRISSLEGSIGKSSFLKELEADANSFLKSILQKEKESSKILDTLQDKVMVKGLAEGAANFDQRIIDHSKREFRWLISFIVFSVLTAVAIGYVVYLGRNTQSNINVVSSIFQRILILSAPAIFLKISLSKYHLERNLRIIYDHRATVLEQFKTFESAIGDDTEAKNKFRLEIVKHIFSDPQTGYISQSKSREVSVNPIINIAEKMATKLNE